ncbi:MAG: hypothetical protein KGL35_27410 [Bradyrhizobium sp.]|nr:hypothetical protein [Bradyrhizobium sp.]
MKHTVIAAIALLLAPAATMAQVVAPIQSSGAAEGSHIFCGGNCTLRGLTVVTGASAGFVLVFNQNSDPANGAVVPTLCLPVGASSMVNWQPSSAAYFANGLTIAFSTGANCFTKTESATAVFAAQAK